MERTHSRKKEGSDEYEDYKEVETLNSMVPLWKKNKSEVTEEQLAEFYKDNFHDYEKPLKSIYAKIEGGVTYDTILFVPSHAPYDYYSKDYKKGVKLYSNGVLITEKCEDLLPDYYGFVKGVVDSGDLSLNISRRNAAAGQAGPRHRQQFGKEDHFRTQKDARRRPRNVRQDIYGIRFEHEIRRIQ